jgi:pimeloyl-ACP methyl ester carboxylesterase
VSIHYIVDGEGPAAVLVHGFAASLQRNWRAPGIFGALVEAGRQVVALDCRGHGESGKPHDPEAYAGTTMGDDVLAVMDHLGIEQADLIGHSMGAAISAALVTRQEGRFRSVVLGGVGDRLVMRRDPERAAAIARALEARELSDDTTAIARGFRVFAERLGNDLAALSALQRASRFGVDRQTLGALRLPVLVVIGQGDTLAGPATELAGAIQSAQLRVVPGDHLTAVGAPELRRAILDFLAEHSPVKTT